MIPTDRALQEGPRSMASRREEWERMKAEGRTRFLLRHGVLVRGVPMALLTMLVIEAVNGTLGPELVTSPAFHGRLLLALVLFSVGGMLAGYARWRALAARFEEETG